MLEKSLAAKQQDEERDEAGEVSPSEATATATFSADSSIAFNADHRLMGDDAKDAAAPAAGYVNSFDLARNATTATTEGWTQVQQGKVTLKESAERKKSRALKAEDTEATAEVTALVGLLRAAW